MRLGLNSTEAIAAYFLRDTTLPQTPTIVRQARMEVTGDRALEVFYKQYEYRKPSWALLMRSSKARCEYRNYGVFIRLGIPCAEAIACGEQRDALGRLRRAFILTRAIPGTSTLKSFWQQHCLKTAPALLREVARRSRYVLLVAP